MTRFGDFKPICRATPSYPWCNLFFRQLLRTSNTTYLTGDSSNRFSAPIGINPACGIPRVGFPIPSTSTNSLGNIANIIACALSIILIFLLIWRCSRRKAAVGRLELRTFLMFYLISLPLQLVTTGALLPQGGRPLAIVTAVHAGVVAALFWALLANGIVATQIVEDGTWSSLVPYYTFALLIFALTTYVSLDVGLGFTTTIGAPSNPPDALRSISLFVLLNIWPAVTVLIYLILMSYIVLHVLNETKPMYYYVLAGVLFVLAQLAWFLLGQVICQGSSRRVDGSFVATVLETAAVLVLYLAWKSITEESWDEETYYPA